MFFNELFLPAIYSIRQARVPVFLYARESHSTLDASLHASLVLDSKLANVGQAPGFPLVRLPFLVSTSDMGAHSGASEIYG
jgi:hypothetical protein